MYQSYSAFYLKKVSLNERNKYKYKYWYLHEYIDK